MQFHVNQVLGVWGNPIFVGYFLSIKLMHSPKQYANANIYIYIIYTYRIKSIKNKILQLSFLEID